ncbi:MAG: DUF4159 domain-containing protein [Pseudomonadota bacterium]|nr:DUF4159 domain-containing protein [Pseudomonadota bacterium]MEC9191528.1 DUF4159 domain-containing protein [Pseudomonadota bacterium]
MEKQTLITLLLFLIGVPLNAQVFPQFGGSESSVYDLVEEELGEFNFVRVQYDTYWGGGFGYGTWSIDFPDADMNFLRGVSRLTNIKVERDPIVLRFDDEQIFDYPFLYMLEVGQNGGIVLSPKETENLREYLLRGGFLLIDDFWGQRQWDNFYAAFSQVFPDREIIELSPDHEIFHVYYDINGPQMIPALYRSDEFGEQGIDRASNHAILDDSGRVMVLINWNSDMGDGWEHTYHQAYPTRYANNAYRLGINYLMYSMTH